MTEVCAIEILGGRLSSERVVETGTTTCIITEAGLQRQIHFVSGWALEYEV